MSNTFSIQRLKQAARKKFSGTGNSSEICIQHIINFLCSQNKGKH